MEIRYFDPLSRGYMRMKKALFQPFDNIKKWLVVGFTAFLAGLTDCHGGNAGHRSRGGVDWEDVVYFPRRAEEWLLENPQWFAMIVIGVVLLVLVIVLLTWLSARGRFMFLDNVVHDKAEVARPWHEFRREGNSLFLFNVVVGFAVLIGFVVYIILCYTSLVEIYEQVIDPAAMLAPAILMVLGILGIVLFLLFVNLMLVDFVVPLMYKNRVGVLAGWGLWFHLFRDHILVFFGYALLVAGLMILVGIAIMLAVVFTCCVGLIFLVLPYVNSVVLLPVSYTMRAFSVEFLGQFGPGYVLFPNGKIRG